MTSYIDVLARDLGARFVPPPPPRTQSNVVPYARVREHMDTSQSWTSSAVASVQISPKTVAVKRYVVIDASQRDWVKQPNPYNNLIFVFGSQVQQAISPTVYSNNAFVPTFGTDVNGNLNTVPGLPNTLGWYFSNVFYPAYNSSLPRGNTVGVDTGYVIQPSGYGFGSVFTASNVQSIRLIRAILPQRQFLNVPILPGNTDSTTIQSTIVGKSYSTFSTYPYLLLYLNEYYGQYVGGNEPMRRAFSVMTQKTRTQTDFAASVGVQHYDYEPWGEEALQFQSPITNLQQLQVSITDPIGSTFAQNDALSISLIQADASFGLFLKCFTGSYQYFSSNELRVGDRVTFDRVSLSNMLKAPLTSQAKKDFITAVIGQTFPVLELLDYVPDSNGIYVPRGPSNQRTAPYNTSFNGFLIASFSTPDAYGNVIPTYSNATDVGNYNVLDPLQLIGSNLPFLNVSLQPVFTLELTCLVPDTVNIGGNIVL